MLRPADGSSAHSPLEFRCRRDRILINGCGGLANFHQHSRQLDRQTGHYKRPHCNGAECRRELPLLNWYGGQPWHFEYFTGRLPDC